MTSGESKAPESTPSDSTPSTPKPASNEIVAGGVPDSAPSASMEAEVADQTEASEAASNDAKPAGAAAGRGKPAGLGAGPLAARGLGIAKPASPVAAVSSDSEGSASKPKGKKKSKSQRAPRPRLAGERPGAKSASPDEQAAASGAPAGGAAKSNSRPGKVAVPNQRQPLPDDIQAELDAELAGADIDAILGGAAGMPDRREPLDEGARLQGIVLKIHADMVFVGLGGPDEGVVAFDQFEKEPTIGEQVDVMVRGLNSEDGLYVLTLPGQAVDVNDWGDLDEGSVVEATVTGHNTGGLECKVGAIKGFMPISQVTEYRVEDLSEFVDQKFVCLVTEANTRRGNLVLSRRAILEREREEKRKEQLEKLEVGDELDGVVRSVKDFGAFVDLGGLDGLIHISKLSWDRVKHPSEVLEVGQEVKVRLEKVDKQSGKISLSYRDLLENPWDTAEASF
ncbi:MAG: S1 RNA-binding domain-containing protein, partial [Planctomycetota bacterium]